jgi:TRAP-type transport system periplasmic protein
MVWGAKQLMVFRIVGRAIAATLLSLGTAAAQDCAVELKFAHWLPADHVLHKTGFEAWARSIEAASDRSLKVVIHGAQELGRTADHYEMARDGVADFAFINPGYVHGRFPIFTAIELPFSVTDPLKGTAALDRWYRKYAAQEMPDVRFCLAHVHDPGALHARMPVATPSDIEGARVRTVSDSTHAMVKALGGVPVRVPAPEARKAIKKGAIDAVLMPWSTLTTWGVDTLATYHLDLPIYVGGYAIVMNTGTYARLSPAQRKVVDGHCTTDWAVKVAAGWAQDEQRGHEAMLKAPGHTVHRPTGGDLKAWRDLAQPLVERWNDTLRRRGVESDSLRHGLRRELLAANAAY